MDFGLTEEQRLIRETVREFVAGECPREQARELDERGVFPGELLQKLAGLGFCALTVPEKFDGAGPNLLGAAIVVEEVARICPSLASAFACTTFRGGQVLGLLGSSAQKESLLPQLAAGTLLFSYALPYQHQPPRSSAVMKGALNLNSILLKGHLGKSLQSF